MPAQAVQPTTYQWQSTFQWEATFKAAPKGPEFYRGDSRYTWPGDLRKHLAGPPHNLKGVYVQGVFQSLQEVDRKYLIQVHDRFHVNEDSQPRRRRWRLFR